MSINIFNRDDGNKQSRYAQIDRNFDAYWEHEARNPNRNRIRIGRQYQATVPSLIKSPQSDERRLDQLETLRWSPDHSLTEPQLQQYVQVARMLSRLDRPELGANMMLSSGSTTLPTRTSTSNTSVETTTSTSNDTVGNKTTQQDSPNGNSNKINNASNHNNQNNGASKQSNKNMKAVDKTAPIELSLARLIAAHHVSQSQANCKLAQPQSPSSDHQSQTLALNFQSWTPLETALFTQALTICGKNLALIRQQFLPWKSAQSLMDAYYDILNQARQNSCKLDPQDVDAFTTFYGRPARLDNLPDIGTSSHDPPVRLDDETLTDKTTLSDNAPLGSLKFFKDGQLVLKLDAKQPMIDRHGCQWTEAADSVSRLRPTNGLSINAIRRKRAEQMRAKVMADECPDESNASTNDDDSLDSADTCLSPATFFAPPSKRTRIRVENNCKVPVGLTSTDDHDHTSLSSETTTSDGPDSRPKSARPVDQCKSPHIPSSSLSSSSSSSSSSSAAAPSSSLIPPVAHASSRSLDRLTAASLALDLTRKLASAHPLAAALAESAQRLPTTASSLPPCKVYTPNSFEPIDFGLGSASANASNSTTSFSPAALLNLIKGVDSK